MSVKPIIYVKIGGRDRPVRFGRAAIGEFGHKIGYPAEQMPSLGENATLKEIQTLVWAGLWDGARKERLPFEIEDEDDDGKKITRPVDVYDVQDWLDEMDDEKAEKIEAQIIQHMQAAQSENGEQEKKVKTKTKSSSGETP